MPNTEPSSPALENSPDTALLMPGGGARAAYQVGVIKAFADICAGDPKSPFPILCGTSAGALNAVGLASRRGDFQQAARWLEELWLDLEPGDVYRSDLPGILRNGLRLVMSLMNDGVAVGRPVALLDNLPLKKLLRRKIDFSAISDNILDGRLYAVGVTAMNYTQGISESFFQGGPENAEWQRWRRRGVPTPLQLRHLLASTAIPTIFPPQRIGRNYYGDGALRQLNPISPALHLGARKVMIVAVSGHRKEYRAPYRRVHAPTLGQIVGNLLNSAFIDSLETDIEMLERINELIELVPDYHRELEDKPLKSIDSFIISPSKDIDELASAYVGGLPRAVRTLLGITGGGDTDGGINIASYLLFTRPFCERLIELGYNDGLNQAEDIRAFLAS